MSEIHERNESLFPAEKVKELRLLLGCSQEEFSKIMGVTVATLSRWETAKAVPRGRNELLLRFLRETLDKGENPSDLKKILLVGGALVTPGTSPAALLQSGFLTREFLERSLSHLFEKEGKTQ